VGEPFDGKSVLIVDDDEDILTALQTAFADAGATVSTAKDGNEALEMALRDTPDLIVLDAMLPKRSGFLVLERLKAKQPRNAKPHIVMITGNPGKRHQLWAESLGVEGYFTKPFRMEKLVEHAGNLLAKD